MQETTTPSEGKRNAAEEAAVGLSVAGVTDDRPPSRCLRGPRYHQWTPIARQSVRLRFVLRSLLGLRPNSLPTGDRTAIGGRPFTAGSEFGESARARRTSLASQTICR